MRKLFAICLIGLALGCDVPTKSKQEIRCEGEAKAAALRVTNVSEQNPYIVFVGGFSSGGRSYSFSRGTPMTPSRVPSRSPGFTAPRSISPRAAAPTYRNNFSSNRGYTSYNRYYSHSDFNFMPWFLFYMIATENNGGSRECNAKCEQFNDAFMKAYDKCMEKPDASY